MKDAITLAREAGMGGDAFGWLASNHAIEKFYTLARADLEAEIAVLSDSNASKADRLDRLGETVERLQAENAKLRSALAQQEKPVAWVDMADGVPTEQPRLWQEHSHDEVPLYAEAVPAAQPDWSLLEATQESLREHMAMVKELRAKLAQQGDCQCADQRDCTGACCVSKQQGEQQLVGFMSPKQLESLKDPEGESGEYIPMRKTAAGNFTLALYAGAAPAAQPDTWTDDGGWTFPIEKPAQPVYVMGHYAGEGRVLPPVSLPPDAFKKSGYVGNGKEDGPKIDGGSDV